MIAQSLSWLLLTCKPRKRCSHGTFRVSTRLRYISLADPLDEHTIILAGISYRIKKVPVYLVSFRVSKIPFEPPRYLTPPGLERCSPGVCVDGVNVKLGSYKSYIFESFALVLHDRGDYFSGNLFTVIQPRLPGWYERWRSRRALRKAMKTATSTG